MSKKKVILMMFLSFVLISFFQCEKDDDLNGIDSVSQNLKSASLKGKPGAVTAGNNLSYPVIWAESVAKTLPGTAGIAPKLEGEWWYWWGTAGTDSNPIPLSSPPDPDNPTLCDDGIPGKATGAPPGEGWVKAYLQKDIKNIWQAGSVFANGAVNVDAIDWGDNLESVSWYTTSKVRTEVVLYKNVGNMLEYEMRHVYGLGIDEVHGLAFSQQNNVMKGPGNQATVYSNCARLTIQKLLVDRNDAALTNIKWVPAVGWTEINAGDNLINDPIFNSAVYEGQDGPGYYSAEINVKGRVIYGYTWDVNKTNDKTVNQGIARGFYRITFSLDDKGPNKHNAFFTSETQIYAPIETILPTESNDSDSSGGVAKVDHGNNLSYIDINILEKSGSSGKGGGGRR